MSRRRNRSNVVQFPKQAGASTKPLSTQELKDHEKLALQQFRGPQEAVIAQAQAASEAFVRLLMKTAKLAPEKGWVLNLGKMRWEQYPTPSE